MICPKCGAENDNDYQFCMECGSALEQSMFAAREDLPEEKTIVRKKPAFENIFKPGGEYIDERNAFAEGLPEWSLRPPQVVVRRKA